MVVTLSSKITIGTFSFSGVHEVRIKRSVHSYIDTALIKLPATTWIYKKADPDNIKKGVDTALQFKENDPVTIQLGYDGEYMEEFIGFVKRVNIKIPCEIECEGYSKQLSRTTKFNKSWKTVQLKDVLNLILVGTDIKIHPDTPDTTLTGFIIHDKTALEVLDLLKKEGHVIAIYFIGGKNLYVGPLAIAQITQSVKYKFGYNTIRDDGLKYRRKEDVKVFVSVTYKDEKGKSKHVTHGDKGGIELTYKYGRLASSDAAIAIAVAQSKKYIYDGFEGKIKTFLVPFCQPGWKGTMIDTRYQERNGDYIIETVEVEFGTSGARRIVEIGQRINKQK